MDMDNNLPGIISDLPDLNGISLADALAATGDGDDPLKDTLNRIAPSDGNRVLLVAASFNSAI